VMHVVAILLQAETARISASTAGAVMGKWHWKCSSRLLACNMISDQLTGWVRGCLYLQAVHQGARGKKVHTASSRLGLSGLLSLAASSWLVALASHALACTACCMQICCPSQPGTSSTCGRPTWKPTAMRGKDTRRLLTRSGKQMLMA
jgi:hypothetical protein